MADGRSGNGGHKTAGRKPKAQEFKAYEKGAEAMEEHYGSVEAFWLHMAKQSEESFPHLKLLVEYTYGKAPETYKHEVTASGITITLPNPNPKKED